MSNQRLESSLDEVFLCASSQQSALTKQTVRDGWLHTGDLGVMDKDGFVTVVDRLKDMIVSGGENVFSAEVEQVLSEHPDIKYCAVIGIADEKWGERVHAVLGVNKGVSLDLDTVRAFCKTRMASFKCPRSVDCTSDPLPLSAVGKVQKNSLRKKYSS